MEHSSAVTASIAEEQELDWARYDPPEALNSLPMITNQTIIAVVQSSLVNIRNQVNAERQRVTQLEGAAESDETPADAEIGKGKGKEKVRAEEARDAEPTDAKTRTPHDSFAAPLAGLIPMTGLIPFAGNYPQNTHLVPRDQNRPRKRSRFGISRIFRHVRGDSLSEVNGESSSSGASLALRHHSTGSIGNSDIPSPTPFTRFVYKHLKTGIDAATFGTGNIECVSCFDDFSPKEGVKTTCHFYCKECFERLVETAVENENQWPPKCCLNTIPFCSIKKNVSDDLLNRCQEKAEEYKVPIDARVYCSEPDCGVWIRKENYDRANKTGTCPSGHAVCLICRQTAHPADTNCPQDFDQQMADRLAQEEGWRRCITCRVLVEHREACHHMTCRCGAQFCYVCGLLWKTCSCTVEQLTEIKQRAAARRTQRTEEEEAELRGLAEALRQIEEFERREAEKAAERRQKIAEERARREEECRKAFERKYHELRVTLKEVNDLQRTVVAYTHDRERDEAIKGSKESRAKLAAEQEAERAGLRDATAAKIKDREASWERDYCARVVWEKKLEEGYRAVLEEFWAAKTGGALRAEDAMRVYRQKNDKRMAVWKSWRAGDLEKFRFLQEDELAIREELMDTARQRLEQELAAQEADLVRRHRAQTKWFDLVVAERDRVLDEVEVIERETAASETASRYSAEEWWDGNEA